MSLEIVCDGCGKRYKVTDRMAGRRINCKICGASVLVPGNADEPEPDAPIAPLAQHENTFRPPRGHVDTVHRIDQHIATHIGPVATVYHELLSDLVHVDIHVVKPTLERSYWTLVTSGMSDLPMTVPESALEYRYCELVLSLPKSWPMSQEDWSDERHYWPIRWLKQLARFPHEYQTWLGLGHTVPNGNPPEPFSEHTELCGAILLRPMLTPTEFYELVLDEDKTIHFLSFVPIYNEELQYKIKHGSEGLYERLERHEINELLDLQRRNACKRTFWPF